MIVFTLEQFQEQEGKELSQRQTGILLTRLQIKVAAHTNDVLWRKILIQTQSRASLNTGCILNLFNPIELWSIAMHCGGQ